jgi:hypothetical protein
MHPGKACRHAVCLVLLAHTLAGCGGAAATSAALTAETPARSEQLAPSEPAAPGTHAGAAPASADAASASGLTVGAELVYEATFSIGVYQVARAIDEVLLVAQAVGGQLVLRGDDRVVFRVPRERFQDALGRIDRIGDVQHRDVHAEDVGQKHRDLQVRLRNARAMRDRLEKLLDHAGNVKDSLEIEAQLSRITEDIERLAAELAALGEQIAYSKIIVVFQPQPSEQLHNDVVRLPFSWLKSLGLATLLDLRE